MKSIGMKTRLITVLAGIMGLTLIPAATAQTCSNKSLKGSYGYTVTGTVTASTGPFVAGPFAAVGRIIFDGEGHVQTVRTLSDDGTVIKNDAGTGTYTISPDCTGSFNITVGPPGNTTELFLNLVLDDSYEIRAIVTNTNFVLVLQAKRQWPVNY